MMPRKLRPADIIKAALIVVAAFAVLAFLWPGDAIIELFNGMFLGVFVVVAWVFGPVTWATIRGQGVYGRAQQMALALAIGWAAALIRVFQSMVYRATNEQWVLDLPTTAFVTMLLIISGVLQATAPGFQNGYIHGRDKRILSIAIVCGIVIGGLAIWLQR